MESYFDRLFNTLHGLLNSARQYASSNIEFDVLDDTYARLDKAYKLYVSIDFDDQLIDNINMVVEPILQLVPKPHNADTALLIADYINTILSLIDLLIASAYDAWVSTLDTVANF